MQLQTIISSQQFEAAATLAQMGQRTKQGEPLTKQAARLYFVEGKELSAAAKLAGVTTGATRKACDKLASVLENIKTFNEYAA